jgi:dihydropteroate synthase
MGVVNVTPDSFSDGGRYAAAEAAAEHARALASEGADLLDVGGESSRPGAQAVTEADELRRVLPVLEAVAGTGGVPISVDTTKAEVARQAIARGAAVINDITALRGDPEMARVVAESGAGLVLMHMQGQPRTMQVNPEYGDVVTEVYDFLAERVEWAEANGIPRQRIALDPGIGFGKRFEHNLLLLRELQRFGSLGCAVLSGTSRKAFLGQVTGRGVADRSAASLASALAALVAGASVVRVHEVAPVVDALAVWRAQLGWPEESGSTGS